MRKLTISDAAEKLGIKKESVYKRVQRGTLPHTKTPDGRVYVYLDDGKSADKNTVVGVYDALKQRRAWWDYVAGASGVLAILGATIYVLGIFALWAPIFRTYTGDFVMAWHAASLVPRTVIVGLGAQQLVAFPLFVAAAILGVQFVVYYVVGRTTIYSSRPAVALGIGMWVALGLTVLYAGWRIAIHLAPFLKMSLRDLALLISLALFSFVLFGLIVWIFIDPFTKTNAASQDADESLEASNEDPRWLQLVAYLIIFLVALGVLAILLLITYLLLRSMIEPELLLQRLRVVDTNFVSNAVIVILATLIVAIGTTSHNPIQRLLWQPGTINAIGRVVPWPQDEQSQKQRLRSVLFSLAWVLGSVFLAAFMLTFVNKPPLPTVKVYGSPNVSGHLLTHVDGYWYVFNRQGTLVSIPDAKVNKAEICPPRAAKNAQIGPTSENICSRMLGE